MSDTATVKTTSKAKAGPARSSAKARTSGQGSTKITSNSKTIQAKVKEGAPRNTGSRGHMYREVFGLTDVGLVRDGNEDAMLMAEPHGLYVVADGMGGHACGEVASAFTIEAIRAFYDSDDLLRRVKSAHRRAKAQGNPAAVDASFHGLRLRKAVESANISVFRLAQQHEQLRDMGTTVVGFAFIGKQLFIANVGDSRAYRLRGGKLQQLTEDHSLLNEYIKMNLLQPDEIENFPYKNVIVRALGLQESVGVDIFEAAVRPGDQYLLCSDGLTDLVRDNEIRVVLGGSPSAEVACQRLTDFAKERGGHDNITTIVVRTHAGPPPAPVAFPLPPPGPAPMDAAFVPPPPPAGPAPQRKR